LESRSRNEYLRNLKRALLAQKKNEQTQALGQRKQGKHPPRERGGGKVTGMGWNVGSRIPSVRHRKQTFGKRSRGGTAEWHWHARACGQKKNAQRRNKGKMGKKFHTRLCPKGSGAGVLGNWWRGKEECVNEPFKGKRDAGVHAPQRAIRQARCPSKKRGNIRGGSSPEVRINLVKPWRKRKLLIH